MTYQPHHSEDATLKPVARLGDTIETDLHSWPFKLAERLDTPASVAYANHILRAKPGVWRVRAKENDRG